MPSRNTAFLALAFVCGASGAAQAQQGAPPVPEGYEQPAQQQPPPGYGGQPAPAQQGFGQVPSQQGYGPAAYPAGGPEAQPPPDPELDRNRPASTVTFNPLALLVGVLNFEYEYATTDFMTFYVGPQLWLFPSLLIEEEVDILAVGLNTGVRFFPSARAPEGFWLGPDLGIAYVRVSDDVSEASAVGYSAMGMLGYTWIWGAFVLSAGGGVGYLRAEAGGSGVSGVQVGLRASIGFAF